MKNKIQCEIIQDLFPSYIDELTSEATNKAIEEHMAECGDCRQMYEDMKAPEEGKYDFENEKEIDFLKKTRRKNKSLVAISVAFAIAIIVILAGINKYIIGNEVNSDYVACNVSVQGSSLQIYGKMINDRLAISKAVYSEEDGVVKIAFKSVVKSFIHEDEFSDAYKAGTEIKQVMLGDDIIWANGRSISKITSKLYNARNKYVGDAHGNGKVIGAMNMSYYTGHYTMELQTTKEPYGMKFIYHDDYPTKRQDSLENMMKSYGYLLLAEIENLGEVEYEYMIGGKDQTLKVTQGDADNYAGADIKEIGKDICSLQNLVEKTGLTSLSYIDPEDISDYGSSIRIDLANFAEDNVYSVGINLEKNGQVEASMVTEDAYGNSMVRGEVVDYVLLKEDFGGFAWVGEETYELSFSILDKEGHEIGKTNKVQLNAQFGRRYEYELSGNAVDGYKIEKINRS